MLPLLLSLLLLLLILPLAAASPVAASVAGSCSCHCLLPRNCLPRAASPTCTPPCPRAPPTGAGGAWRGQRRRATSGTEAASRTGSLTEPLTGQHSVMSLPEIESGTEPECESELAERFKAVQEPAPAVPQGMKHVLVRTAAVACLL